MKIPINLLFARHGKSEQNIAYNALKNDDVSFLTREFRARLPSHSRLTALGIKETQKTGAWIKKEFPFIDTHITSTHIRAIESSIEYGYENTLWVKHSGFIERSWGALDYPPEDLGAFLILTKREMRKKDENPFLWRPPEGENYPTLCERIRQAMDSVIRKYSGETILISSHGDVMKSVEIILGNVTAGEFNRREQLHNQSDVIRNGEVHHYTRKDPYTSELHNVFCWVRKICPTVCPVLISEWEYIKKPTDISQIDKRRYSTREMNAEVNKYPRIFI